MELSNWYVSQSGIFRIIQSIEKQPWILQIENYSMLGAAIRKYLKIFFPFFRFSFVLMGKKAIDFLSLCASRGRMPDLIFLNRVQCEISGREIAFHIRALEVQYQLPRTPIILYHFFADLPGEEDLLETNIVDLLVNDGMFDNDRLLDFIDGLYS